MDKFFTDPDHGSDFVLRFAFWGLSVVVYLSVVVFYPYVPSQYQTHYALLTQTIAVLTVSSLALTPAMRDLRDIVFYELLWYMVWGYAYFAQCDWYDANWFYRNLMSNWTSFLAVIRLLWFAPPGARLSTNWPIFGIIGFITRTRHRENAAPTLATSTLVWALIWLCYPLAWYCTVYAVNTAAALLMVTGGYAVLRFGKRAAIAFAAHIRKAQQNQADLDATLPQIAALQAALAKAAANQPLPRTRTEALVAMQKWLSPDELLVLNAMREVHPRVIPMLVDSLLNLAGNIPRPPLTLVPKPGDDQ